jgi:hypothetical protein
VDIAAVGGDDAAVVAEIAQKQNVSVTQVNQCLNDFAATATATAAAAAQVPVRQPDGHGYGHGASADRWGPVGRCLPLVGRWRLEQERCWWQEGCWPAG